VSTPDAIAVERFKRVVFMEYHTLGHTSLRVSPLGFGCSRLGGTEMTDGDAVTLLLSALDRGINFYDTADVYASGRSESLLGKAFKNRRTSVVIATKCGYHSNAVDKMSGRMKSLLSAVRFGKTVGRLIRRHLPAREQSFSAQQINRAIEASLRRLGTDYVDVFQLHSPPASVIERGDFVEVLERAKTQGKLRSYGISCRTAADADLCLLHPGISSVQIPISLLQFEHTLSFLALAKRRGVAVIARQPLASGFLARPISTLKARDFSCGETEFRKQLECLTFLRSLQLPNNLTIAQAALQFVIQLQGVSVTIAGMSTPEHLNENIAASAGPFTEGEISRMYSALFKDQLRCGAAK